MPAFTPLVIAVLVVTHIGELAVAWMMIQNGYAVRWKSLVSLLIYRSICGFIFGAVLTIEDPSDRAAAYFYVFWTVRICDKLLQYWVLGQIVDKLLPCSPRVRRIGAYIFAGLSVATIAFSLAYSWHVNIPAYLPITQFVFRIESATSLAWCLTFLLVAFGSGLIGIIWRTEMLAVASGFAIHVALRTLTTWAAIMRMPSDVSSVLLVGDFSFMFSLAVWIYYFRKRRQDKTIDTETADEMCRELRISSIPLQIGRTHDDALYPHCFGICFRAPRVVDHYANEIGRRPPRINDPHPRVEKANLNQTAGQWGGCLRERDDV